MYRIKLKTIKCAKLINIDKQDEQLKFKIEQNE